MRLWVIGVGLPLLLYAGLLWSARTKVGYPVLPFILSGLLFLGSAILRDRNQRANGPRVLDWVLLFFVISGTMGIGRILYYRSPPPPPPLKVTVAGPQTLWRGLWTRC